MRPLSLVPTSTPAPRGEAATEKAVTLVELQSTPAPPSGEIRKPALREFCNSWRLRAGCRAPVVTACAPLSSVTVTVPVTVPPALEVLTLCDDCALEVW